MNWQEKYNRPKPFKPNDRVKLIQAHNSHRYNSPVGSSGTISYIEHGSEGWLIVNMDDGGTYGLATNDKRWIKI